MSASDFTAFRARRLGRAEIEAIGAHVRECTVCAARMWSDDGVQQAAESVWRDDAPAARPMRWIAAAAAVLVLVAIGVMALRREKPTVVVPARTAVERPSEPVDEWMRVVNDVRAGASLTAPAIVQRLRPPAERLRGASTETHGALSPAGVVITTHRPAFSWPATRGARYVVTVFENDREVARSKRLHTAAWTCDRDLPRGVTYHWEVDVETESGDGAILPEPPAPQARFHVLDAASLRELDRASTAHPADHLLLAVLYARYGLDAEAARELTQVLDAALRTRLQNELRGWPQRAE